MDSRINRLDAVGATDSDGSGRAVTTNSGGPHLPPLHEIMYISIV